MTTPRRLRLLSGSTELRRAAEWRANQWAEAKGLGPMFRVRSRDGGWSWQARPKPLTAPMSEQWLGLHNSERHGPLQHSIAGPFRHCACGLNCLETNPCLCCLAAEVERLKAQVQKVREVCHQRAWWALQDSTSGLRTWVVYLDDIKRALDGGQ